MIRSKPSNLASILVALLPIPLSNHIKGHGKTTTMKEQQIHNREVLRKVFEITFHSLDALFNTGKLMLCADGRMRQCDPVICAWMVNYIETVTCIQSSSPIALCAKHRNCRLEKGIHRHGN